jgi:SAM-dependent methyltransferase
VPDDRRHATSWAGGEEAARYEHGRPGYPPEVADVLVAELGLRAGDKVLDLAAGTGKLTRVLAAAGVAMVAAEPMPGMRAELAARAPGVPVVAALAEALPVRDGGLQAVVAAQAVHWFRWPDAAIEVRRVLTPAGGLAIVTNRRDPAWPATAAVGEVLDRYEALGPRPDTVASWREGFAAAGAFTSAGTVEVAHEQRFADRGAFDARFASVSFAILLPDEVRARMLDDLWAAAAAGGDPLVMPLLATVEVYRPVP